MVRCGMEGGEEGKKEGQRRTSRASGPCRPRRWDLGRCRVRKDPSRPAGWRGRGAERIVRQIEGWVVPGLRAPERTLRGSLRDQSESEGGSQ